jgi:hypothetical protein
MVTGDFFCLNKVAGGVTLTAYLHLVPRSKMVELFLHSFIRLSGVLPN